MFIHNNALQQQSFQDPFPSQVPSPSHELAPGRHLIRVCGRYGPDTTVLTLDTPGPIANARVRIPLRFGRLYLARAATPIFVSVSTLPSASSNPPRLQVARLPRLLVPVLKLLRRSRFKTRIPLLNGGYLAALSGWRLPPGVAALRERQRSQRRLAPFGLHDANIPLKDIIDNDQRWLTPAARPWRPRLPRGRRAIAVALHLYYADLWPEFATILTQIKRPFDLIVSHCGAPSDILNDISDLFPGARLAPSENLGRDIWPFLHILNEGLLEDYLCVCKIHSKKSIHSAGAAETLLGRRWRRRALLDLLGEDRSETIAQMFEDDPFLGLVGPESLRLPNAAIPLRNAWGAEATRRQANALARRMGADLDCMPLDFFAGSMFWVTPGALAPLRRLNLGLGDFPDEAGQLDGELQHAIERLFPLAARLAGRHVAAVPPLAFPVAEIPAAAVPALARRQNGLQQNDPQQDALQRRNPTAPSSSAPDARCDPPS